MSKYDLLLTRLDGKDEAAAAAIRRLLHHQNMLRVMLDRFMWYGCPSCNAVPQGECVGKLICLMTDAKAAMEETADGNDPIPRDRD